MKKISFIVFIISLLLSLVSMKLLDINDKKILGDAISGEVIDGKYYIMNNELELVEVTKAVYTYNYSLWVITIVLGIITGISMIITLYVNIIKKILDKAY